MKINRCLRRFLRWKKKSRKQKKIVFTSCSFVCFFVNSFVESLFVLVFLVLESNSLILFEWSSAFLNSEKYEIVREEEIRFLDEKLVIKSDVSNFYETNNSSFSSLNKFCVEVIEVEKKENKESIFCFEFFAIDFALDCFHVNEIENLWSVITIIEESWKHQKVTL